LAIEVDCGRQARFGFTSGIGQQVHSYFSAPFFCWVALAEDLLSGTQQAINESKWCIPKLDSPEGRKPFPANLPPDQGMFYSAWKHGSAWPCDTLPAVHALSASDRIFNEDRYRQLIVSWLGDVSERLDPETGLLPHTAELPIGRIVGVARATLRASPKKKPRKNPSSL
jgi:hypothetical protein